MNILNDSNNLCNLYSLSNYIALDLEFTMVFEKGKIPEIIQIGSCYLNGDTYSTYIRPQNTKKIPKKLKEMCGFEYKDVDYARTLDQVKDEFIKWIDNSILLVWGTEDKRLLKHYMDIDKVVDVQIIIAQHLNRTKANLPSLEQACIEACVAPEGNFHNALTDAQALMLLVKKLLTGEDFQKINNNLVIKF